MRALAELRRTTTRRRASQRLAALAVVVSAIVSAVVGAACGDATPVGTVRAGSGTSALRRAAASPARAADAAFAYGGPGDVAVPGRWAPGQADVAAVFRPATGTWFVRGRWDAGVTFGGPGDIPVPGDYDGDGLWDPAVFRPSTGMWYWRGTPGGAAAYGGPGDIPVPGDYNGDGRRELGVYRPATGTWFVRGIADGGIPFGAPGDVPLARRWVNGSPKTLPTVFRPRTGQWFVQGVRDAGSAFGGPGDVALGADFGGTDAAELSVWRPANGRWFDDRWAPAGVAFGGPGDIPVPADYDADGHAEPAVFRPATGMWFTRSGSGDAAADPVVIAAGDIACAPGSVVSPLTCQDAATRALVPSGAAILALGDLQYETGSADAFAQGYALTWGRLRGATFPAVGNHEYLTPGAAGFRDFFGAASAAPTGHFWYSTDIGRWHVVVLDANCGIVDCTAAGAQARWLTADLTAHPGACTLAAWHQPRFSSGVHGDNASTAPFWDILTAAGAELILNGHDHDYERFAPQRSDATPSAAGPVEVVVGTGGKELRGFGAARPNSVVRNADTPGVLEVTLHPGGYDARWRAPDGSVRDAFSGACH